MGRCLGIDFGMARIGLAISDENQRIALPIGFIRAGKTMQETAKLIDDRVAVYSLEKVVIGLPLQLNGQEGEMAKKVRLFAEVLQNLLIIPFIFWDERLTSAQVERHLKDSGMNRKKRAKHSDEMAAMTILQNYLDSYL